MGTSRTAIKAPPQSLEALDTWGDLDKLPWSLDDAVWTTAGVYALSLSEIANSGQMVTLVRKKIITLDGSAIGSESAVFASVLEASARGAALSGATVDFIRLRPVYASLSVTGASGEAMTAFRVRCGEPDPADAAGSGQIRPEYKGWGWRRLPDSNTEWRGIVEWQ